MHEVSCSNPGLCKYAYFIKMLYLSSRGLWWWPVGWYIYILFYFAIYKFFLFFIFLKNYFVETGHSTAHANRFLATRSP